MYERNVYNHDVAFFCRESEICDVRKECSGLKQEIDRLDSERETLLSKIEAGDGVNTALQQLKQQNVSEMRTHV